MTPACDAVSSAIVGVLVGLAIVGLALVDSGCAHVQPCDAKAYVAVDEVCTATLEVLAYQCEHGDDKACDAAERVLAGCSEIAYAQEDLCSKP